ncbi:MAG TPA: succinate dehydrogenase iron-sulfur subunit [Conexivisphaerales archaeon]|nr:succinate dehydrogenase iron-sulfur subunit [Conexivisphaerales archaeon]
MSQDKSEVPVVPLHFDPKIMEGLGKPIRNVGFKVFRYDPAKGEGVRYSEYQVPIFRGTTVLDALLYIKEKLDPSLSIRYSCRMAVCGSCGMVINGKEMLACKTQVENLGGDTVVVRPMNNMPVTRDLVSDFEVFFQKHRSVLPYIVREDVDLNLNREYIQKPEEVIEFLMFSNCIKCGLCYSACPTNAMDESFLGPQAMAQAYRYIADTRDGAQQQRMEVLDASHGLWNCHFAGSCSDVCPKGVDPAFALQELKTLAIRKAGTLKKKRPAPNVAQVREYIPEK